MTRPQAILETIRGISLTEMLVVVALIAVLAALAIPQIGNLNVQSEQAAAELGVEQLNRAVQLHNQAWRQISIEPSTGTEDEMAVVELLQTPREVNPGIPMAGSPFLEPTLEFSGTSDSTVQRARWNGAFFELIPPQTAGAGLDLRARIVDGFLGE